MLGSASADSDSRQLACRETHCESPMSQGALAEGEAKREFISAVSMTFVALSMGHLFVDSLATLVPACLGLIEVRSGLTPVQSAWLMGLGTLTSGLAQPICAIISDRLRTRVLSAVGIILGGAGFAMLGFAESSLVLGVTYMIGMIGNGMFHPIAATTVAQMYRERRNAAASIHFVAGMIGGVLGAMVFPRWLSTSAGFVTLPYIAIPAVLLALVVLRCQSALPAPQGHNHQTLDLAAIKRNWKSVWYLYLSSALRYCVNTALVYLFVRWAEFKFTPLDGSKGIEQIAKEAAPAVGNLNAAMIFGMAIGGILAGRFVRPSRERTPMIWVPVAFAPLVALFPYMSVQMSYVVAALAGIGFSSMIPISVALAQHLLPHRAYLASSLMMGGAWTVATIGPRCAELGVKQLGLNATFLLTGVVLAASGIVCMGMGRQEPENSAKLV
jgi:MFS transporter, FSR family, fosmidomycin resistance protein